MRRNNMKFKVTSLLLAAALFLSAGSALADSINVFQGHSIPGKMNDVGGTEYVEWKWLPALIGDSDTEEWHFGLQAFNLSAFMGLRGAAFNTSFPNNQPGAVMPQFTVGTFKNSPTSAYWAPGPQTGNYVSPTGPQDSIGITGTFSLDRIEFANTVWPGDTLTLIGNLIWNEFGDPGLHPDFSGLPELVPFTLTALRVSNNSPGVQNFVNKYNTPGANALTFQSIGTELGAEVPEPGTLLLFGPAAGVFVWLRRRKKLN
jgi:hypothetical protein